MPFAYTTGTYQTYTTYTYSYVSGSYNYLFNYSYTYNYTASGTGTGTTYNQYIRIMKSVAGAISEVTNWLVSTSATIASFRVKTSGTNITVQTYSDSNLTTKLGTDLTYSATTATPTGMYGIGLKPSSDSQSYTVASSATITRN